MPPGLRRLCIAVDDVGLHPGIHEAARRLAEAGRVQALGCQVGGAAFADAARLLRHLLRQLPAGSVELGLHLDLTEAPLPGFPARPLRQLVADAALRRLDASALRRQVRFQLDAFAQAIGRLPDYVDGHQHVHQLPGVREALLAGLDAVGALAGGSGRRRPWLRATAAPASLRAAGLPWFKPAVIARLGGAGLARQAAARRLATNRCLLGVYGFDADPAGYTALLAGWLGLAGDGDLLMCHPGEGLAPADPIARARRVECAVLAGAAVPALCREAGVVLQPLGRTLGLAPGDHT